MAQFLCVQKPNTYHVYYLEMITWVYGLESIYWKVYTCFWTPWNVTLNAKCYVSNSGHNACNSIASLFLCSNQKASLKNGLRYWHGMNSLAPRRCSYMFKGAFLIISCAITLNECHRHPQMARQHGSGLVPSGHKPSPESNLTKFHETKEWHLGQYGQQGPNSQDVASDCQHRRIRFHMLYIIEWMPFGPRMTYSHCSFQSSLNTRYQSNSKCQEYFYVKLEYWSTM